MADYSWHERMRDFAFGQKPSAKYVKKKKKKCLLEVPVFLIQLTTRDIFSSL